MDNWEKKAQEWKLDPLVKDLVILLNQNGIRTFESCQGHLAGEDGKLSFHFPFIALELPPPKLTHLLIHSIHCPRYPLNEGWVLTGGEWYDKPLFFLEPLWALIRMEVSRSTLSRTQEDFNILYKSFKFHLEAFKEGKFETLVEECVKILFDKIFSE